MKGYLLFTKMSKKVTSTRNVASTLLLAGPFFLFNPSDLGCFGCSLENRIEESKQMYQLHKDSLSLAESVESEKLRLKETPDYIKDLVNSIYIQFSSKMPSYLTENYFLETIKAESNYNPQAVSDKGARGLMQIMPNTWNEFEKNKDYMSYSFDAKSNIFVGMKYILWIDDFCKNNHPLWGKLGDNERRNLISSAYHGGITRLLNNSWNLHEMPSTTQKYVKNIQDGM